MPLSGRPQHGGVAQLARALGSYPSCHRFESSRRYQPEEAVAIASSGRIPAALIGHVWPGGQAVKTPPFHGGNTGSIPVRVTKYGGLAQPVERLLHTQEVTDSSSVVSTKPNPLNRNGLRGFRFAFEGCFEPPYFPYFRIFSGHLGARCCKSVANFFDPLCHAFSHIASLTFSAVFPSRERRS